jgi:hypothetical protein
MKKFWFVLPLYFLVFNCTKESDNEDKNVKLGNIIIIQSRGNISIGQSDTIFVVFDGGETGCSQGDHLEASISGSTVFFKAYYNNPKEPFLCPDIMPVYSLTYIFKPKSVGTYKYKSFDSKVEAITNVN